VVELRERMPRAHLCAPGVGGRATRSGSRGRDSPLSRPDLALEHHQRRRAERSPGSRNRCGRDPAPRSDGGRSRRSPWITPPRRGDQQAREPVHTARRAGARRVPPVRRRRLGVMAPGTIGLRATSRTRRWPAPSRPVRRRSSRGDFAARPIATIAGALSSVHHSGQRRVDPLRIPGKVSPSQIWKVYRRSSRWGAASWWARRTSVRGASPLRSFPPRSVVRGGVGRTPVQARSVADVVGDRGGDPPATAPARRRARRLPARQHRPPRSCSPGAHQPGIAGRETAPSCTSAGAAGGGEAFGEPDGGRALALGSGTRSSGASASYDLAQRRVVARSAGDDIRPACMFFETAASPWPPPIAHRLQAVAARAGASRAGAWLRMRPPVRRSDAGGRSRSR